MDLMTDELVQELNNQQFDYLFVPDVLEHVNNPALFLARLHLLMNGVCRKLIITTPDVFRYSNFFNALRNMELINSDHRYWFSPYTLSKVVIESGFQPESLGFVNHSKLPVHKFLQLFRIRLQPVFRLSLIHISEPTRPY